MLMFQACCRGKTYSRSALSGTTYEHELDTTTENTTFESLFQHLSNDINQLTDNYVERFRYTMCAYIQHIIGFV